MLHHSMFAGVAAALAALTLSFWFGSASQDDPLKAADAAFERKEYAAALAGYQAAAKLGEYAAQRDHIHVRIGLSLARLERHDEALATLDAFARDPATGAPGAARARLERGVIAATMPHNAYEKDGKRTRGTWVQGATYTWTAREDFQIATSDLDAAAKTLTTGAEGVRARLEIAAAIEAGSRWESEEPADTKPAPWEDRMIAAFDAAILVATAAADREAEALARYLKGVACVRLLHALNAYETRDGNEVYYLPRDAGASAPKVKLPGDRNPLIVLAEAAGRARGTRVAAPTLIAQARIQTECERFVDAVSTCQTLVNDHPKSPFAGDAKALIEELTFPAISIDDTHAVAPGERFKVRLQARNVKEIACAILAAPIDALYRSDSWLNDARVAFGQPEATYERLRKDSAAMREVATFTVPTGDGGIHQRLAVDAEVPPLERGAYFLEARANGVVWRSLILASDLSVAAKLDGERAVLFAADAQNGKSVEGVEIIVREHVRDGRRARVTHQRATTDARGLASVPRASGRDWSRAEAFAVKDGRLGIIEPTGWSARQPDARSMVAFIMTDRPVYRPGDPVRIAALARNRTGELDYEPIANRGLRLRIRDPKGQEIFNEVLRTDASGLLSQEVMPAKGAPLGVYGVTIHRDGDHVASSRFRVEEYLKPEFDVKVRVPDEQVRLGEKVSVTVEAAYYFGGGVPGAQVTWNVHREVYVPSYPWHRYGSFADRRIPSRGGRELVASGQGPLDSEGHLAITFDTAPFASTDDAGSRFIVEADVMDSSRRTIRGSASILLAKRALVLGVHARRGFYVAGDVIECETRSQLPAGGSIQASGVVKVYKLGQKAGPEGTIEETRTLVHEEPHATDAQGVGFFRWQTDAGGHFGIAFEARDRFEQPVEALERIWVYDGRDAYREFAFANIELVPDARTFKPGQTAKILVKSALADATVFYSVDAGASMLRWDVMPIAGRLGVIELPIERGHMPNVHVHVLAVAGGRFFEDKVEIFVPPEDRILDVSLAFEREAYRPGTAGDLVVTTKTSAGEPVAARLAVTVLDASILAIQADESRDISQFFYGGRRYAQTNRTSSAGVDYGGYLAQQARRGEYTIVGGYPQMYGPEPGFVSRLFRGEGFGALELESWLAEAAGERRKAGRAGAVGAAAPGFAADAASDDDGFLTMSAGGKVLRDVGLGKAEMKASAETGPDGEEGAERIRTDFRDSALWTVDVQTGADGKAAIKVPFPDSLTTWRAKAWAWTPETRVGQATADVTTTKDVLVRIRAPRFFVEGDAITVSALVNNRTAAAETVAVRLAIDEHLATALPLETTVTVQPRSDARVDWTVQVMKAGSTKITAHASGSADKDAIEMTYPVLPWGSDKVLTQAAVLEGDASADLAFLIPAERRVDTTTIELALNPSLAITLLDALPYLIDYPYGCTEQTLSRFVPAVIVARLLREHGVTLEDLAAARQVVAQRERDHARVLSSRELEAAVREGVERLARMQNGDGGFGWWKDVPSSAYLTAYVLQGLLIARDADVAMPSGMLDRAASFLAKAVQAEQQLEQATFAACVLAKAGKPDANLLDRIFRNRDALNPYGKALLASAMQAAGRHDDALLTLRNLVDFASRDVPNGTAHWTPASRQWWWWWNSPVETNAAVLAAFVDVDPDHEIVRPLVKWLVTNRRGGKWTHTRDTAHAIIALARYAKRSGELDPDLSVAVSLAGGEPRTFTITKRDALLFDGRITFDSAAIPTGDVKVSVRTRGKGRLYAIGFAKFYTMEADITGAGNDLLVERAYFRVKQKSESTKVDGRDVIKLVDSFEPLSQGAEIKAGDVVEVRLKVDAKNDYDYLLFEDMKPSGFEPLEVKSGFRYGGGICSNIEFRDTRTALFATWLQQGTHSLSYRLRAEVPGTLRTLPARGHAMYAPDIAGTSSSFRFTVLDSSDR